MIKILADQNLYKLDQFLPQEVEISYYDPSESIPSTDGFDAWLLRTVTKVDEQNFPNLSSKLTFIGTGSAGSDHLDIAYLESQNINVADAKGCNARAVAEYLITSLLILQERYKYEFRRKKIGIIGVGTVGTAVAEILAEFGCKTVLYDPPRSIRDPDFESANIEEIKECDIISLHVPMISYGEWKTHHLIDKNFLEGNHFDIVINAARGGVACEHALIEARNEDRISYLITDVWENEPHFKPEMVQSSEIATPHIAGYSEQAKLQASSIITEKLCSFFGLKFSPDYKPEIKNIKLADLNYDFMDLLLRCHPILEYDSALRDLIGRSDSHKLFAKLRTDRPYRYEYPYIRLSGIELSKFTDLIKLGVSI